MTDSANPGQTRRGPRPLLVASGLGVGQMVAYGTTLYFIVLYTAPLRSETGWSLPWVMAALTVAYLVWAAVSARIGLWIRQKGGRPVLCASTCFFAAGLVILALAHSIPVYLLAWAMIGLGMGTGFYDVIFSTLGRLYGVEARRPITTVTLIGGFASTVFWPIGGLLITTIGWRWTAVAFAAMQLLISLPLYLMLVPRVHPEPRAAGGKATKRAVVMSRDGQVAFFAMCCSMICHVIIGTTFSLNLITILKDRGLSLAGAIALGAVIGPATVGSRLIETVLSKHFHPSATLLTGLSAMAGSAILLAYLPISLTAMALVVHGIGLGLYSVARGALPIFLYGRLDSAVVGGRIGRYIAVVQAVAPLGIAWVLTHLGVHNTLLWLFAIGLVAVSAAIVLHIYGRRLSPADP